MASILRATTAWTTTTTTMRTTRASTASRVARAVSATHRAFDVERATETVRVSRDNASLDGCEYEVIRARARGSASSSASSSSSTSSSTRVFVVPGNPGVPAFYETFALALGEATAASSVEVVGYLGHTVKDRPNRTEWFTLDEQKEHVREYIERRLAESSGDDDGSTTKCVVVGHSIGAHVALHARRALGRDKVHGIIGLMPFLHVNERSALQKSLSFVTRLSLVAHALGKLLDGLRAALPSARLLLLRAAVTKSMDTTAAEITSAWLRWQSLINMVFMGRTEFDALTVPVTECPLVASARPSELAVVYAHNDHWAPLHQRDALASIDVDVTTIDADIDVAHDFVVNDASARVVAALCVPLVARLVRREE